MYMNKKIQQGGKKIGKGGFSCVVKPYISCNNTKKNVRHQLISKITKKKTLTSNYIKVNKILKKIDKNEKYFRHFINYCKLKKSQIKARKYKDIKFIDSNILNNLLMSGVNDFNDIYCEIEKNIEYYNIIENYGGHNLHKILQYKLLNIKNKLNIIVTNLLEGLKLLHDNNIVHRDVKIDNITINSNYNATYIDFNTSILTSDIKKISIIGNHSYNISIDYMIFFYLYRFIVIGNYKLNKKLINYIDKICNKNIKNSIKTLTDINISYKSLISFDEKNINKKISKNKDLTYERDNIKFYNLIKLVYKKFISLKNPLDYFKNDIVYKNDVYGLGIVFKIILTKLFNNNITTEQINSIKSKDNQFNIGKFNELINKMTIINPNKRFTATEAYNFWTK
jgi:serine/threonine protein kinase